VLNVAGVVVGIFFGAIPGLTANMAVALCLPITFGMSAVEGFLSCARCTSAEFPAG
jgi:putative tricarboxylic transport membrane protein